MSENQKSTESSRPRNAAALGNGRILTEGLEVRGGVGSIPTKPKPQINIVAQKPSSTAANGLTTGAPVSANGGGSGNSK